MEEIEKHHFEKDLCVVKEEEEEVEESEGKWVERDRVV